MAKTCIGLDLGSSAVKVAQVKVGRAGACEALAFGIEPIPNDSIVDGTIMNQSAVVDAVRTLFARLKLKQKDVALAISGHSVIIKKITVAPMKPEDLDEQIPWEAEQHIPFAKDDVEIDYQLLAGRNAQGQMEVLLVAAKKEVVRDFAAVAREAQLNPVVVDVAAFALQNAYEMAYEPAPHGQGVVLINVGAATSNINIVADGTSAFTRDVTIGGALFTDEIKRQLNVSHEEAEEFKFAVAEGEAPREVQRVLQQTADQMAGEFSKSLDFFLTSHPDTQVSKIILAGGGARLGMLHRAIEQRAHVKVELMDPFRHMTMSDSSKFDRELVRNYGAQGAIAVGLAMRSPGDKFE